jgi:hypothetical protein
MGVGLQGARYEAGIFDFEKKVVGWAANCHFFLDNSSCGM